MKYHVKALLFYKNRIKGSDSVDFYKDKRF